MTFTVSNTVSDETLNAIIQIESGGRLNIKAQTSSALGLGQFLKATWLGVVKKHRPDLLKGRSQEAVLALRTDPQIAVELLARFTEDNQRAIGMNATGGDLYLAHFLGVADARDLFRADPSTPVSKLVTVDVINANKSIMQGKTASQVRAWAAKRMHDSGGRDWVAKYYAAPAALAFVEEPAPAETEPSADDFPDPQDAPAPIARRDPVPAVTKADDPEIIGKPPTEKLPGGDGFFAWCMKIIKSKIAWASVVLGSVSMSSILEFFKDWRTIMAVAVLILVAYIIYERGRKP